MNENGVLRDKKILRSVNDEHQILNDNFKRNSSYYNVKHKYYIIKHRDIEIDGLNLFKNCKLNRKQHAEV